MKTALCVTFFLGASFIAGAADTAYSALRIIGKQSGTDALNRVAEVRGRFGVPQPETWKVVLQEPSARGGIREFEVQKGKVVSEKTPAYRQTGTPMNFNQLNLDSDGVFTIVNQETEKNQVSFDRVDYTLKSGSRAGAPVWQVELFDGRDGRTASYEIAADSGTILRQEIEKRKGPVVSHEDDRAYLYDDPAQRPRPRMEEGGDDAPFFSRLKRRFQKRGKQFENFFTGRGWTAQDH